MDRRAVGGEVSPVAENTRLLKHVALRRAEGETLREEAPSLQQKTDTNLDICKKIRKKASLTPPGIIDALCEGRPIYGVCPKAIYIEEVIDLARMLGRAHLLNFDADC